MDAFRPDAYHKYPLKEEKHSFQHARYNFLGCAIFSHAMVVFALIVFSSLSGTCLLISW